MKTFNLFKRPLSALLTLSLSLPALAQNAPEDYATHNTAAVSAPPKATGITTEDPRAFEQYLSYMNPSISHNYNIETTWIVKGEKEPEESVLRKIEGQLRSRLTAESNIVNLPSWLASEAIIYQRQVVCDLERTDIKGTVSQTIRNTSNDQSSVSSQVSSANSFSNRERVAISGGVSQSNALAGSHRASDSQSETYKINGNTVIVMEEKIYSTQCVKKHYEFRGTLVAERVMTYAQVDNNLKLYFVRKGLQKIYTDFLARFKTYSDVLQYVLNTPNMTLNEVKTMGAQTPATLISGLKTELSSLISTYKYFVSTAGLFRNYHFSYFAAAIDDVGNDMKMKLISIQSQLESFEPTIISIGFIIGEQVQPQYFYSQEELVLLFAPVSPFQFKSRMKNPLDVSKTFAKAIEKVVPQCQTIFNQLLRNSQAALTSGKLAQFDEKHISAISDCTQSLSIKHSEYSGEYAAIKYLVGKSCIFVGDGHRASYQNNFRCQ